MAGSETWMIDPAETYAVCIHFNSVNGRHLFLFVASSKEIMSYICSRP